jgi:hypothetical protein
VAKMDDKTREEISALIDSKIREHELKVGWVSGLIGVAFVLGIIHSIWLLKFASFHH